LRMGEEKEKRKKRKEKEKKTRGKRTNEMEGGWKLTVHPTFVQGARLHLVQMFTFVLSISRGTNLSPRLYKNLLRFNNRYKWELWTGTNECFSSSDFCGTSSAVSVQFS
jgi:hypothetical protein